MQVQGQCIEKKPSRLVALYVFLKICVLGAKKSQCLKITKKSLTSQLRRQ